MPTATTVRSFAKINLGLRIGPPRPDGYHSLVTLYQTIDLYDLVAVTAEPAPSTAITLSSNQPRVPTDSRNTAHRIVAAALERLRLHATVHIHLEKQLPMQGGLGAGSANAAAALVALEAQLGRALAPALAGPERLEIAAAVGSDVPLFLLGGTVYGHGRGELVVPYPDLPATPCVVALPGVGSSTPLAFRAWDSHIGDGPGQLTPTAAHDRLTGLSRVYASAFASAEIAGNDGDATASGGALPATVQTGASGVSGAVGRGAGGPEGGLSHTEPTAGDLAGNPLLRLVRTGIENDFEEVVFQQHPSLRAIKHALQGTESADPGESHALYAALSGSGSSLFGLYRTEADAGLAQGRVRALGVEAVVCATLPRRSYRERLLVGSTSQI